MPQLARIPLSIPSVGEAEAAYVRQCIEENWVASCGRFVSEFEALFASIHNREDAVSVTSGTAALHLACLAAGLGPGDEVLVPALTFVASANAVSYTGATPVFIDVEPETYTLDPAGASDRISDRTRAIMVVHLYGQPANMDAIGALASERGLFLIEDATGALGSRWRGQLCGTFGDFGCFSFNGNKMITAGGGGMVLARNPERLNRIRHLSFQARVSGTTEYHHDAIGFNYTLSNLHAAVGLAQLERLDDFLARRRAVAARYRAALADASGLRFSLEAPLSRSNYWLMSVLVEQTAHGRDRAQVITALDEAAVDARPFFTPLPLLMSHFNATPDAYPVARGLHEQGVSIPSSANLNEEQQDRVIAVLLDE